MKYVGFRNWGMYQHYRNRKPPWVKLHVAVLEDEDHRSMSSNARLLWFLLLPVAANKDNRIPNDPSWIAVEVGMRRSAVAKALAELLAANALCPASKPASNGASESAP